MVSVMAVVALAHEQLADVSMDSETMAVVALAPDKSDDVPMAADLAAVVACGAHEDARSLSFFDTSRHLLCWSC